MSGMTDQREAIVRIRDDPKFGEIRPAAAAINGKTISVRFGWYLEDNDDRYPGEAVWLPEPYISGLSWIATGDLEFV